MPTAILTAAIPQQRFEAIRDQIGAVLATEFSNQFDIIGNAAWKPQSVWIERIVPLDKQDLPCINVRLANIDYDIKTASSSTSKTTYNIFVYTKAKSSTTSLGDAIATINNQRITGMVRAILDNPNYRQLGDPQLLIQRSRIAGITVLDNVQVDDINVTQAAIEFEVTHAETNELLQPFEMLNHGTQVKLFDTDKGYYYGTGPDYYTLITESGYAFITEDGDNYIIT
jgi:hypothetical protein